MNKPHIRFDILTEEDGYSAVADVAGKYIGTQGDTLEELKENILEAVNLAFSEDGITYKLDEIELRSTLTTSESSLH